MFVRSFSTPFAVTLAPNRSTWLRLDRAVCLLNRRFELQKEPPRAGRPPDIFSFGITWDWLSPIVEFRVSLTPFYREDEAPEALLEPNTALLKFENEIRTTVTLSKLCLYSEFLMIDSAASPHWWWMFVGIWGGCSPLGTGSSFSFVEFHTAWIVSSEFILSKIPSLPSMIKSLCFWILKDYISGVEIITLGFPPLYSSFASASPKVRETESLPGRTLNGPTTISFLLLALGVVVEVW